MCSHPSFEATGLAPWSVTKTNEDTNYEKRKNINIILAEDDSTSQQIALMHLKRAGYMVVLAENGKQAVDLYKAGNVDIVLMDIQMPELDGYEATKKIREFEKQNNLPKIPIIAMTAHAFSGYREKCLANGMDDYITKPVRRKKLIKIVDSWAIEKTNIEDQETQQNESDVKSVSDDHVPLNFKQALEEFENDKEFLLSVLEEFLDNVESQIPLIREGISNDNFEVVRKEAHSIKGGAANLTAEKLSAIALELEETGKKQDLGNSPDILSRLEKEYNCLKEYIEHINRRK